MTEPIETKELPYLPSPVCTEPDCLPPSLTVTRPTCTLQDLPGISYLKNLLLERVVLPLKFPELFPGSRSPPNCIYLYGPPGSGKSQLAAACAGQCCVPLYSVSAKHLATPGSEGRFIRATFRHVRTNLPAILLITSIEEFSNYEEIGGHRPILTELVINLISDQNRNLSIILTSNDLPCYLMRGIRRRIEREAYVPLPDAVRRRAMLRKAVHLASEREYSLAADLSEGLSFWEIQKIVKNAVLDATSSASLLDTILSAFQATVPQTDFRSIQNYQTYVTEYSD